MDIAATQISVYGVAKCYFPPLFFQLAILFNAIKCSLTGLRYRLLSVRTLKRSTSVQIFYEIWRDSRSYNEGPTPILVFINFLQSELTWRTQNHVTSSDIE